MFFLVTTLKELSLILCEEKLIFPLETKNEIKEKYLYLCRKILIFVISGRNFSFIYVDYNFLTYINIFKYLKDKNIIFLQILCSLLENLLCKVREQKQTPIVLLSNMEYIYKPSSMAKSELINFK